MTSISDLSALPTSPTGSIPCRTVLKPGQHAARRRARTSIRIFAGAGFVLGSLFFLGGCGDETKSTGTVEVDQSKVKAEQDKMKEAMEKAHGRPTGGPKGR